MRSAARAVSFTTERRLVPGPAVRTGSRAAYRTVIIGVAESARFLRGHANWFLRLVQPREYKSGRFLHVLMPDLAAPDRKVVGLHVFTFNEIEPTERWRQEMLARLN